jgi:hypothetical protein
MQANNDADVPLHSNLRTTSENRLNTYCCVLSEGSNQQNVVEVGLADPFFAVSKLTFRVLTRCAPQFPLSRVHIGVREASPSVDSLFAAKIPTFQNPRPFHAGR